MNELQAQISVTIYFRFSNRKASRLSAVRCATNIGRGLHQNSTFHEAFVLPVRKDNRLFTRSQPFVAVLLAFSDIVIGEVFSEHVSMQETVTLNTRDQKRVLVLNQILEGHRSAADAA